MTSENPCERVSRKRTRCGRPADCPWGNYAQAIIAARDKMTPRRLTESFIEQLTPHLAINDVRKIYQRGKAERTYFVGPPLRVHGALQVFCIDSPRHDGLYGVPMIYYAFATRRPESYVNHPNMILPQMRDYEHSELAEEFACANWPEELVWDDCKSVMCGFLIQPGPDFKRTAQFTCWSQGELLEMLAYDHEPTCEVIDDSLLEVAIWQPSMLELSVNHSSFTANFCSLCGGGIVKKKCTFCEAVFNMPFTSAPWPYALPQLVAAAYKWVGFDFKIAPIEARKAEHRAWAQPGYTPAIPNEFLGFGKQQRIIEL